MFMCNWSLTHDWRKLLKPLRRLNKAIACSTEANSTAQPSEQWLLTESSFCVFLANLVTTSPVVSSRLISGIMRVWKLASSYVAPSSSLTEADPTTATESHSSDTVDRWRNANTIGLFINCRRFRCRRLGVSPFWPYHSVTVLAVAVLACRRYSLSPFWLHPRLGKKTLN